MPIVKLKIDISGTVGDEVWRNLRHFEQIERASISRGLGSGSTCNHPANAPHSKGEWISAEIQVKTPLLAQYAVSHYLEQERVLDADVVDWTASLNGLGIILYFILRQPLHRACPQWGNAVQTGFNFCPRCNYKLSPSCPQCQRLVGVNDVYCPYCGTSLHNQAAAPGL